MRILFLCHRLPYPPKRGGKIRPFNMIRHLARSHEVTVATLARSAAEPDLHCRGLGPLRAARRRRFPVDLRLFPLAGPRADGAGAAGHA